MNLIFQTCHYIDARMSTWVRNLSRTPIISSFQTLVMQSFEIFCPNPTQISSPLVFSFSDFLNLFSEHTLLCFVLNNSLWDLVISLVICETSDKRKKWSVLFRLLSCKYLNESQQLWLSKTNNKIFEVKTTNMSY